MAKDKTKSGPKHIHARLSYLQKAATYLTAQSADSGVSIHTSTQPHKSGKAATRSDSTEQYRLQARPLSSPGEKESELLGTGQGAPLGLPSYLMNHLVQVSRKQQIRLQADVKHGICTRCGNVLTNGQTSRKFTENLSFGGRKPQADVLVLECGYCSAQKRFPVGARRQQKKALRDLEKQSRDVNTNRQPPSTAPTLERPG